MRDILLDIVKNTYGLGIIDLIKITGTAEETLIETYADQTLFLTGKTNKPVTEFANETFGMPNLDKLNTILGIPEYADGTISMNYETDKENQGKRVCGIHFENSKGDFKNDYRFMSKNLIQERIKGLRLKKVITYGIDFVPTASAIQRLKFQASANSEELFLTVKVENNNLKFYFGDASVHAGNFVFQSDVSATLSRNWSWKIAPLIGVLSLSGDKTFGISDDGMIKISVDTGLATYTFLLLAETK